MENFSVILATISLIIWLYLIFLRGRFWWADQVLKQEKIILPSYPSICGIIPARNEAEALPISLPSLLKQDYAGEFNLILIND
jgi:cellulose synthase/poly-beta-1,6-N-acetylglucosamine synthase-like glycosyltransferase